MKSISSKILKIAIVLVLVFMAVGFAACSKTNDNTPKTLLSNKNATVQADNLYNYILSVSGNGIISGQQESTWISTNYEFDYIFEHTGKYPAIRGFDFIGNDFDGVVERAKDWAARGGIVTICWHCSEKLDGGYDECKAGVLSDPEFEAIMTEGTPEHAAFIANLDKAGAALAELKDAGIPVLWRPYHEFNGWWFWWGKLGGEKFKRLWIMTYEHMTNDLHLDNLIWVLGYSYIGYFVEDYYPGDAYYDIIGADSYLVSSHGAEQRLYDQLYEIVGDTKPIAFHETGLIPTVEQFKEVQWVWFMTWHTNYLIEENTVESLNTLYNDPYVITLSDLPNFYA